MHYWLGGALCPIAGVTGTGGLGVLGSLLGLGLMLAAVALAALLIVALVRRAGSIPGQVPQSASGALQSAQLRYAKGELSREQYLQLLADLNG